MENETALALAKALNDWSPELKHAVTAEGPFYLLYRMAQAAAELSSLCIRIGRTGAPKFPNPAGPADMHDIAKMLAPILVYAFAANLDPDDLERCIRESAAEYALDND